MTSLNSILYKEKGVAGHWNITCTEYPEYVLSHTDILLSKVHKEYVLYHHGTRMLQWTSDGEITYAGIGHGSVSDQRGMNKAFRMLGFRDYHYYRDRDGGGPRITKKEEVMT